MTLDQDAPDGTYTVIFDVLSAVDGHRTKGAVSFFVGPPGSAPAGGGTQVEVDSGSSPPRWLEVSVRWFNFAAMAALIGAALFPFLVLARGFARLTGKPGSRSRASRRLRPPHRARAALSLIVAAFALLAGTLLSLWIQVWSAGGSATETGALEQVLRETRFGEIWIFRIGLVAIACVTAVVVFRQRGRPWQQSVLAGANSGWLLVAGLAIAIPGTTSLNSHAAASGSGVIATVADWIHLVAGGVWVGGLIQLGDCRRSRRAEARGALGVLRGLIRRFSLVAVISVSVIVATGIFQSIERLGGVDELVDTAYGSTLLVKLLLLTPLLLIAAFNLLVVGPRFVSMARGGGARVVSRLWENRFRVAVSAELAIAAFILVMTAATDQHLASRPGQRLAERRAVRPARKPGDDSARGRSRHLLLGGPRQGGRQRGQHPPR